MVPVGKRFFKHLLTISAILPGTCSLYLCLKHSRHHPVAPNTLKSSQ